LEATNSTTSYNIKCFVEGGGHSGQAGAVKHGISRILAKVNDDFHAILRNSGHLTRDDRKVERKKPGQPKARKKFQFSKR
jgi:small subunit ribosomal protein S9